MLQEKLEILHLPDILTLSNGGKAETAEQWALRRREIMELLCRDEYGVLPPAPLSLTAEILEEDCKFCAGKALLRKVLLRTELPGGTFSFPLYCAVPLSRQPCPAFLHINFRDAVPDRYMPSEELCDHGYAVFSFCYQDVTRDNADFSSALAGLVCGNAERGGDAPGKIALWAWAAMRAMDYIQTLPEVDKQNIAVAGHSRLGKTALLCGALDERFAFTFSNDSGCSGAALSRGKGGESIAAIVAQFPFWFCPNYANYAGKEDLQAFDQHFLLAAIAPRHVYVASAEEDIWADPQAEFLSCVAASDVYALLAEPGLLCPDAFPQAECSFQEGKIGYHIRKGKHYFSRWDWLRYMEYMEKHRKS